MRKLLFILPVLFMAGCSKLPEPPVEPPVEESMTVNPGRLIVKVRPEWIEELENATEEDGRVDLSMLPGMHDAVEALGITSFDRLFPYAGKYEARTRAEGLHLWYHLTFDTEISVTLADAVMTRLDGVSEVEYDPIKRLDASIVGYALPMLAPGLPGAPFNDPLLYRQWSYRNDGSRPHSAKGCDINVFPAWKSGAVGSGDVIVCVVDGGVDYTHEDLAANMWHNPDQEGRARYGYNFCKDTYEVTPDAHATHVSGTIAAVNNNTLGVCGIAGGDYAAGIPGVKIMSCQIFSGNDSSGSGAAAIKWGADHGAVISQNSWGSPHEDTTPNSVKAAVDYFTRYAGLDENGHQTGPMAGGLVVFAAGNEKKNSSSSGYEQILTVTSLGADFCRADYSNWGDFADLAAPGGDTGQGNPVLSTLPGNKYGWMSGTSMACPHVSGVAALIVSIYGGPGFTVQELRERLLKNVTDIAAYNRGYYLGTGLVNASKALQ